MNWIELIPELKQIAIDAGAAILEIYHSDDFEVQLKSDDSPLTKADQAANAVICKGLEALSAQFPIISEENKEIPYEERKNFETHWLVDPLDGTKEFIKRNGEFTVNIALVHQQQTTLGVVYIPCEEELYWAVKGKGAFKVKNGAEEQIFAADFKMTDPNLNVVCSRSHLNEATQAFIDQLSTPQLVPKGSSLKFLTIAKGESHLYPRLGPTMEWDTGAAQIVLEEAGGSVISEETKAPLLYNKENLLNPYFVAYGKVASN